MKHWFWIGIVVVFFSCGKETEDPTSMGYDYFPLQPGMYAIYEVDSFYIDCQFNIYDTLNFQMKEKLDTFFTDASGQLSMRIERSVRNNPSSNWQIRDVWWAYILPTRAVKVEENMKYVKLTFPVLNGNRWDGNAFNSITDWNFDYRYTGVDESYTSGTLQFDSVATVLQQQVEGNLLIYKYQMEKYARGIGMVYQIKINVEGITNSNPNQYDPCEEKLPPDVLWTQVPIMQRIKLGSYWEQKIIDYGME